jgi:GDPmannose 4,6-dehydratase
LIELLLAKGYKVYGTYRRISSVKFWRLEKLCVAQYPNLPLAGFDLTDIGLGIRLLQTSGASEIYNLAAQSFVGVSLDQPYATAQITGVGALNLLEAICIVNPNIRYYQSSTSGMFSKVQAVTLDESTSFYLRSPYGVANLYHRDASESRREQVGDIVASPPWDDRKGNIP